ncbi:MAG: hypothetical protein LC105_08330 [Chitinophagales bacterium]|nr:hypothetical protein [Chitinophagales bacterium]
MVGFLKNWSVIRIVRFILGVLIIIEGIKSSEWIFIVLGGLFSLMAILNAGCGTSACSVPKKSSQSPMDEEVTYEEVK